MLSPLALTAQTAQTNNNMQARLASSAYAAATSNAHPTAPVRVSTGVVAFRLIHVVDIQSDDRNPFAVTVLTTKSPLQ